MRRRLRFVVALLAWLLLLVVGATVVRRLRPDVLIVGGVLGLLVLTELVAPVRVQPEWQRRLRLVLLAAVVLLLITIAPRVYDLVTF